MFWHNCLIRSWAARRRRSQPPTPRDNPIFPPDAKLEQIFERTAKLNSGLTEGPAVAPDGSIYFTDLPFGPGRPDDDPALRPGNGQVNSVHRQGRQGQRSGLRSRRASCWLATAPTAAAAASRAGMSPPASHRPSPIASGQAFQLAERSVRRSPRAGSTSPIRATLGNEPRELTQQAVYRIDPDGTVREVTARRRNAQRHRAQPRRAHAVCRRSQQRRPSAQSLPTRRRKPRRDAAVGLSARSDGRVAKGPPRTLVDFGNENGCDGITVDAAGNLYVTCRSLARPGILVIDPRPAKLAFVPTGPRNQTGEFDDWQGIPSNVEFGVGRRTGAFALRHDRPRPVSHSHQAARPAAGLGQTLNAPQRTDQRH